MADAHGFDLLSLNGRDLRQKPLHERKRLLARIMPLVESRIRLVEGIRGRGIDFFRVACAHDFEGIVAKWKSGTYRPGPRTSWVKIRNPRYSQWERRRDLFDARSHKRNATSSAGEAPTREPVNRRDLSRRNGIKVALATTFTFTDPPRTKRVAAINGRRRVMDLKILARIFQVGCK